MSLCACVRVCGDFFCEGNEKRFRVLGSHLPKCVVDNGESEFEILHDPIDPAVLKALSGGGTEWGTFSDHSHSFDNGIDLMSPLCSFCLPSIEHDAMLNLYPPPLVQIIVESDLQKDPVSILNGNKLHPPKEICK